MHTPILKLEERNMEILYFFFVLSRKACLFYKTRKERELVIIYFLADSSCFKELIINSY
jgi:hypothetical protein